MKIFIIFFLPFVLCLLVACGSNSEQSETDIAIKVSTSNNDTVIVQQLSDSEKTKSKEEIYAELAVKGLEFGRDVFKNMKTNDSIKMANREKIYAYQIGLAISDKDVVFDLYSKLANTDDIYVLKSRKDYFIIKYDGNGEKELNDSLLGFKKMFGQNVSVVNLMDLYSKNRKLVRGENLTKRTDDTKIQCLVCDK